MIAVRATGFGDPSVLALADLPDRQPGRGEVAIDVTHAAVGLVDVFLRQGVYRDRPGMPRPPFVPGLEVTGIVRTLGEGVDGFRIGQRVVSMSDGTGTGGYASVYVAPARMMVAFDESDLDPALAVSVVPNAAMAHVALTCVMHLQPGESVLVTGALGGFSAAFPGMAKHLGAARVVGAVRASKLAAAASTKLPYDRIVDSADLTTSLADEAFDIVIDPVGGAVRDSSLGLLRPGGRLLAAGNASGDWDHRIDSNRLWLGSVGIMGYNAGAYLAAHPDVVQPALIAAVEVATAGLAQTVVDVLPFTDAAAAHRRMEERALDGRIVLTPRA